MKKPFFLLLAVLSLSLFSCKKTGTLTVTVQKGATGQPVPYAVMLLKRTPGNTQVNAAEASAQGVAVMHNVKEGNYKVLAEKYDSSGIITGEKNVSVSEGENANVTVTLQ